jgi:superkiller protein 3
MLRSVAYSLRGRYHRVRAQRLGGQGQPGPAHEALLQALNDFDTYLRLAPSVSPQVTGERARVLARLREHEKAVEAYTQTLELAPNAQSHVERAVMLEKLGRTDEALADMDRAVELDPDNRQNRVSAALLAARYDRLELARAHLDEVLDAEDDGWLRHMRGLLRAQLGDVAGAGADWERARDLGNEVLELQHLIELAAATQGGDRTAGSRLQTLSRGILLEGNQRNQEALAVYQQHLDAAPDPHVHVRRGLLLQQLRRFEEAEQSLTAAVERAAECPVPLALAALTARGELYLDRKDDVRARADFQRATQLAPTTAAGFLARAGTQIQLQDYAAAIADCDRALERNPRLGRAWQLRGMAQAGRGELQDGIADLKRALGCSSR